DDNADLARRRGRANRFEIFDRAIHEAARAIASRHGWDEGVGARCEHELVVCELASSRGRDALRAAVDRFGLLVEMKRDGVAIEETLFDEREVLCGLAGKERRQPDAVIGRARLFAEHGDIEVVRFTGHIFQQALADHAVPDDDEFASHAVCCLQGVTASAPRGGASASARALSASSYRRRSSSFCSRVNRTASAQTAVAATIAPSRNNAYWIVPVPFTRKPAATAPTLPPAPTMPATPPSALRLMKGTRLYDDPQANESRARRRHLRERDQTHAFSADQHEQQRDARSETAAVCEAIRSNAAERTREEREEAEAADVHARRRQRQRKVIDEVNRG